MKPPKNENEVSSTMKSTTKYAFVPPGVIAKGRGRGLKSLSSLRVSRTSIPFSSSTDQVMQHNQITETCAISKGRGCGFKSMSTGQETQIMNKKSLVLEKGHIKFNIPSFSSTDELFQYIQTVRKSDLGKELGLKDMCSFEYFENEVGSFNQNAHYANQSMSRPSNCGKSNSTMFAAQELQTVNKNLFIYEKEHVQADISISLSVDQVIDSTQTMRKKGDLGKERWLRDMCYSEDSKNEKGSLHQNAHGAIQSMLRPSNIARSNSTMCAAQGLQTVNINPLVYEKEHMQEDIVISPSVDQVMHSAQTVKLKTTNKKHLAYEKENVQANIPISPSDDQVMHSSQTMGKSSKISGKVKKVQGGNKCKQVASIEIEQKLKATFYNNRTVGNNSNLFLRHLGKIVRGCNICPLAISSWDDIKEEKLNHMWAAVKDKFESEDINFHRDHVLGWMKELWNKWRGRLHANYVKGKSIQQALKNKPKEVDTKQWEWLIKEHFSTKKFQERSKRNASNNAKLNMLHHMGSKPIREIIYQKGGKDGKPPNMATIFFETRKKNNTLVDSETIEKHAQIQELMQSEPSLPNIEIVEKCFEPQIRSHVFVFGGGVKAKDLKDGTSSNAELWSELRSTHEENQSLNDRLSNIENKMNEMKQLKEWFLAQHSTFQPPTSEHSGE